MIWLWKDFLTKVSNLLQLILMAPADVCFTIIVQRKCELWVLYSKTTITISYLTIIRRRRSEYWWIFPETKSRGIFTNIYEPEANNCFSIITQVIIEIHEQRNVKFYLSLSRVSEQVGALITWSNTSHDQKRKVFFARISKRSASKKKAKRRQKYA